MPKVGIRDFMLKQDTFSVRPEGGAGVWGRRAQRSHKRQKCYDEAGPVIIQPAQDGCPPTVTSERLGPLKSLSIPLMHNIGGFWFF